MFGVVIRVSPNVVEVKNCHVIQTWMGLVIASQPFIFEPVIDLPVLPGIFVGDCIFRAVVAGGIG